MSDNPEFYYEDGFFRFCNGEVEVLIDETTFNEYLCAYLVSKGMDTRTEVELLDDASEVGRQQAEAEKILHNPLYWLGFSDRRIQVRKKEEQGS